jgi:hypothetical protein
MSNVRLVLLKLREQLESQIQSKGHIYRKTVQ